MDLAPCPGVHAETAATGGHSGIRRARAQDMHGWAFFPGDPPGAVHEFVRLDRVLGVAVHPAPSPPPPPLPWRATSSFRATLATATTMSASICRRHCLLYHLATAVAVDNCRRLSRHRLHFPPLLPSPPLASPLLLRSPLLQPQPSALSPPPVLTTASCSTVTWKSPHSVTWARSPPCRRAAFCPLTRRSSEPYQQLVQGTNKSMVFSVWHATSYLQLVYRPQCAPPPPLPGGSS